VTPNIYTRILTVIILSTLFFVARCNFSVLYVIFVLSCALYYRTLFLAHSCAISAIGPMPVLPAYT
jgi:hypothetical protein